MLMIALTYVSKQERTQAGVELFNLSLMIGIHSTGIYFVNIEGQI